MGTYNSARFVREQLESVLSQAPLPSQIVVGDDGSSDGSVEIVESMISDARLRGLDLEWTILDGSTHLGLRKNMNRIVNACRHDVIIICDSDDVCLPGRFDRVLRWFADHPDDLAVCSDAIVIGDDGEVTAPSMMSQRGLSDEEWTQLRSDRAFQLLVRRFVAEGAVSAYRRELLEMIVPCPDALVYDGWLALMASAMTRFSFDERPSIKYRVHQSNISGGVRGRSNRDKLRMLFEPGGDRNERWLERTQAVLDGIEHVRPNVPDWAYELAVASAHHQRVRSAYPRNRLARAPKVLRHATSGAYRRSARGYKDVLLDLVQPLR
jgi:glycosyltransferase involved in cell wall biosynthesis